MTSRTRESGGFENSSHTFVNLNGSQTTDEQQTSVDYQRFAGVDLIGFHKRKRAGELLPHTNYVNYKVKGGLQSTYYDLYDIYGNHSYLSSGVYAYNPNGWLVSESEMSNYIDGIDNSDLVTAAAAKIYSNGHDTLTFIAELQKTIRLFTKARGSFFKLLTEGKKKGIPNLAELWLEYRYGWRILYYDIVDIHKTLESLDKQRTRFSERVGSSKLETTITESENPWVGGNRIDAVTSTWEVSRRGSITADILPPKFQFNPLTTSWELVRFSFIIDWFVGIGAWLESMSFLALASDYRASQGFHVKLTRNYSERDTFGGNYSGTWRSDGTTVATYTVRTPTSVPLHPSFNVNLDVPKGLDLLALLKSYLSGGSFKGSQNR